MDENVLTRVPSAPVYTGAHCRRGDTEDVVISGLAITPSDIERLALNGTPVSLPNANSFYSIDTGFEVPPELKVDADRNTLWETSHLAKVRILRARRREHENLT